MNSIHMVKLAVILIQICILIYGVHEKNDYAILIAALLIPMGFLLGD